MSISSISSDESPQAKPAPCNQPLNAHINPLDKYRPEMEPIKTYLRLRPLLGDQLSANHGYINILNDTDIVMQPPANETRLRSKEPSNYKFTKVFGQTTTQDTVFEQVGLPLLTPVLRQDHYNTLLFAYGVSNSGKTFTVLGTEEHPGILPHALGVVFKSIEAAAGDSDEAAQYCPIGFQDVELCDPSSQHGLSAEMMSQSEPAWDDSHLQGTHIVELPSGMDFAVWMSIAEIYTEKIYDLLAESPTPASTMSGIMSPVSSASGMTPPSSSDMYGRPELRRPMLSLKTDPSSHHKYIHGLREFRVRDLQEAMALVRAGLKQRQVFSTMLNQSSSRSHCIFTIKIIKVPQAGLSAEDEIKKGRTSVSRISIVDLAGSERVRHTNNTGQRLKEAGNINNSLMVLGQCMEVLRLNQTRRGKTPQLVPFRHSKLTELFQSTLEGGTLERSNCQAAMIVNVNPFETSFDENSHVMKFSSVAMNVATLRQAGSREAGNFIRRVAPKQGSNSNSNTRSGCRTLAISPSQTSSIAEEEEVEEEDPHVVHLLNQIEDLRERWLEAENRCSAVESEVREEMAEEMERRLQRMETFYKNQLCDEASMNETKIGRKMDLLTRAKNSEEATVVSGLQAQIQHLEETANSYQREAERVLHSLAQAEQRYQEQARVVEALERQLSQWTTWLQAAPCAATTASSTPPPPPKAVVIRQGDHHGQHASAGAVTRNELPLIRPATQEPSMLNTDRAPPEVTMTACVATDAASTHDLAAHSQEEQVLDEPKDEVTQSVEERSRQDQLDPASMISAVEMDKEQHQREEETIVEDPTPLLHPSIPCKPDTMDNIVSSNRRTSSSDLPHPTASTATSMDGSFVDATDASAMHEPEQSEQEPEGMEEDGEVVDKEEEDNEEVNGDEVDEEEMDGEGVDEGDHTDIAEEDDSKQVGDMLEVVHDEEQEEDEDEIEASVLPPHSPAAESVEEVDKPSSSAPPPTESIDDNFALASAPHSSDDNYASALAPHSLDGSYASTSAPHSPEDNYASALAPHSPDNSYASTSAPHAPDSSYASASAPHSPEDNYASALPPDPLADESMEGDYALSSPPHYPPTESMGDINMPASQPHLVAKSVEDSESAASPRRLSTPEDHGHASKKTRLDEGIAVVTQWHAAEGAEEDDASDRMESAAFDSYDSGQDISEEDPMLNNVNVDQQHRREGSAGLPQEREVTTHDPLLSMEKREEGKGLDQEDMKTGICHHNHAPPAEMPTDSITNQSDVDQHSSTSASGLFDSALSPTSPEHFSPRELAPQGSGAFESLPEHEESGDNYTMYEEVEGEHEQAQVEVEEDEDEEQMKVELIAIKSEFKSPQKASLSSAHEVIEILSSREATPEPQEPSQKTLSLPSTSTSASTSTPAATGKPFMIDEGDMSSDLEEFDLCDPRNYFLLRDIPESERRESLTAAGSLYPKLPSCTPEPEQQRYQEKQQESPQRNVFNNAVHTRSEPMPSSSSSHAQPPRRESNGTMGKPRSPSVGLPVSNGHDNSSASTNQAPWEDTAYEGEDEVETRHHEGMEKWRRWSERTGKQATKFCPRSAVRHGTKRRRSSAPVRDWGSDDDETSGSSLSPRHLVSPPPSSSAPSSSPPPPKAPIPAQEPEHPHQEFHDQAYQEEDGEEWRWAEGGNRQLSPDRRISVNSFALATMMNEFERRASSCSSVSDVASDAESAAVATTSAATTTTTAGPFEADGIIQDAVSHGQASSTSATAAVVIATKADNNNADATSMKPNRVKIRLRKQAAVMSEEIADRVDEASRPTPVGTGFLRRRPGRKAR
ncbi:hypothetical protein DFQ26_007152 [Actinomortierella ambigua]|nr:hypothetical protein DFQ26_007152 [Actinomortierella ambigua]